MNFTPRLERAIRIAAIAHKNQRRKGTDTPYVTHPFSVMAVASDVTDDEDVLIACLFHDIIEDVPNEYPETRMRQEFGDRVVGIVLGVTKDDSIQEWRPRGEAYLKHLKEVASDESVIVSGADKIHNLMSILADYKIQKEDLWQIFSTKSAGDQLWWYESVLQVLKDRKTSPKLIDKLEGLVGDLRAIVTELPKPQ